MTGGRAGTRRSAKRRAILRATQTVMLREGYAAVTFERVATVAGVANRTGTELVVEFLALANHRREVRTAIGECAELARRMLTRAVCANLPDDRMVAVASDSAAAFMLTCIPRLIAMEELVGADLGHSDALVAGHRFLEQAEGPPQLRG